MLSKANKKLQKQAHLFSHFGFAKLVDFVFLHKRTSEGHGGTHLEEE